MTLVSYNCRVKSRCCTTAGDGSSICNRNVGSARAAGERSNFPGAKLLFRRHSVALSNNSVER